VRDQAGIGVEQETSGQEEVRSRQEYHFRGGGSLLVEMPKSRQAATRTERCSSFAQDPPVSRRHFGFQVLMHFSSYLMIVAFVLMGLELAYAFYQLATFVL
jgi:hypothetical protein